jgi:hypothetical protein
LGWLKILDRRVPLPVPVLVDLLFAGVLVGNKRFDFGAVHVFHDVVGLPFFEREAQSFI